MLNHRSILCTLFCIVAYCGCSKINTVKAPSAFDYKPLGNSAKALLTSDTFTTLNIQINYMPGCDPGNAAVDELIQFLQTHIHKPGGITVERHQIYCTEIGAVNLKQIVSLEKKYRSAFTQGNTIAVHILIVNEDYIKPAILGLSYWNTSVCIFGNAINQKAGSIGEAGISALYSRVMCHEFVHLMGLANATVGGHQNSINDPHASHCTNKNCLMYYGMEDENSNAIPTLDDHCLNYFLQNGGK